MSSRWDAHETSTGSATITHPSRSEPVTDGPQPVPGLQYLWYSRYRRVRRSGCKLSRSEPSFRVSIIGFGCVSLTVELRIYAHDWPAQNSYAGDPGGAFRLFRPTHARCG